MRLSKLFSRTLRDDPSDAETPGHRLLLRAGYVRPLTAGVFSYLPLALRALRKIETIIREEMDAIGGQELSMPVIHPASIWQETKRWYEVDESLTRFQDRAGRELVLAMTHEEVITDLVRREVRSYRQLPLLLYQIQTKWRDEPRPRAGLIRVREFTMKDSYSLDIDEDGLDRQYRAHYQAYFNIFARCGLPVISVKSDVGMMGGKMAHEFIFLTEIGEDTLFICDNCNYRANREVATFTKPELPAEVPVDLERVSTPGTTTIETLAQFLDVPESRTAKAIFQIATINDGHDDFERFVLAIVRGDMDVNETKLINAVRAKALRPATEEEIANIGAVAGYGSPVGVNDDVLIVVDDIIPDLPNLVAGANETGFHLKNVNYGRDYTAQIVADIVSARDGDTCPNCGAELRSVRGVEVGNIFKLGTRYSDALGATFLDQGGKSQPVVMGSYGIGVGRLLACLAEAHHDENGLMLPVSVAPYTVHLVSLPGVGDEAERVYTALKDSGIETLYDDRDERAGVKFNDADLIGCPIRLTISKRSLEKGSVEFKRRHDGYQDLITLEMLIESVQAELVQMQTAISETVVEVPFDD